MFSCVDRYGSKVARKVCSISQRTLDYWVTTGVVAPSRGMETKRHRRKYFLFTFDDLVRLKIVKSLRDAGVSLPAIRAVVSKLKRRHGPAWQRAWLLTDGRRIFEATDDPAIVESLAKGEEGQLAMSIVAIAQTQENVRDQLKNCRPVDLTRFDATEGPWERIAKSV